MPQRRKFDNANKWASRSENLSDEDGLAIRRLTGAYDDNRNRKFHELCSRAGVLFPIPGERRCPPWMLDDPEFAQRYIEALMVHEKQTDEIKELEEQVAQDVVRMVSEGELDKAQITETVVLKQLLIRSIDRRRPSVQMRATERLAELLGILKGSKVKGLDDQPLSEVEKALVERLQKIEKHEDKATRRTRTFLDRSRN